MPGRKDRTECHLRSGDRKPLEMHHGIYVTHVSGNSKQAATEMYFEQTHVTYERTILPLHHSANMPLCHEITTSDPGHKEYQYLTREERRRYNLWTKQVCVKASAGSALRYYSKYRLCKAATVRETFTFSYG